MSLELMESYSPLSAALQHHRSFSEPLAGYSSADSREMGTCIPGRHIAGAGTYRQSLSVFGTRRAICWPSSTSHHPMAARLAENLTEEETGLVSDWLQQEHMWAKWEFLMQP